MNWKRGIVFSIILSILTVVVCIFIADELIGVAGTVGDIETGPDGVIEGTLYDSNPTGRIVLWCGLVILPLLFMRRLKVRYTLVNIPLYIAAWYILDAIFGSAPQHGILTNHTITWINIDILSAVLTAVMFWVVQAIVILIARGVITLIKKAKKAQADEN